MAAIDGEVIVRSNAASQSVRSHVTIFEIQARYASGFFVSRQPAGFPASRNALCRAQDAVSDNGFVTCEVMLPHRFYGSRHLQAHQLKEGVRWIRA